MQLLQSFSNSQIKKFLFCLYFRPIRASIIKYLVDSGNFTSICEKYYSAKI